MEDNQINEILQDIKNKIQYDENEKQFIQKICQGDLDYVKTNYKCVSDKQGQHNLFLLVCAITDNIAILDYIVEIFNIDVHKPNKCDTNCLMFACWRNTNLYIIEHLIDHYLINLDYKNNTGYNCLMFACKHNSNLNVI